MADDVTVISDPTGRVVSLQEMCDWLVSAVAARMSGLWMAEDWYTSGLGPNR